MNTPEGSPGLEGLLENRSSRLRRRHRRILLWSMGVAVVLHLGVFALGPRFSAPVSDFTSSPMRVGGEEVPGVAWIDVTFGPPRIHLPGGAVRQEPPGRVLEAKGVHLRGVPLHSDCDWLRAVGFDAVAGEVRLRVGDGGEVLEARLAEGSGERCADQVLVAVAGKLRYHWLPDEEATAPVDLAQPMRVVPGSL